MTNLGQKVVCSVAQPCQSGYECATISEYGSMVSRCCPTKSEHMLCAHTHMCVQQTFAKVRRTSATCAAHRSAHDIILIASTSSAHSFRSRFVLSVYSVTITKQGCEAGGNNFATLAQCQSYCNAAACSAGELVLMNTNDNSPRQCVPNQAGTCPAGYTCRYDSLNQRSVCCGSGNEGACRAPVHPVPWSYASIAGRCLSNERVYMDALSMEPRECLPSVQSSCPTPFACRLNQQRGKYYCCASLDGSMFAHVHAYRCPQVTVPPAARRTLT